MRYPTSAARDGLIGGLYLGFDLTEDGRVERSVVLGEVPIDRFDPIAVKQMQNWQANKQSIAGSECLKNRTAMLIYDYG